MPAGDYAVRWARRVGWLIFISTSIIDILATFGERLKTLLPF